MKKILAIFSLFLIVFFCFLTSFLIDTLIMNSDIVDIITINQRWETAAVTFVSAFVTWLIPSVAIYFCLMFLGGSISFFAFLQKAAYPLIIAIILSLFQLFMLVGQHVYVRERGYLDIVQNPILATIYEISNLTYFLFSLSMILVVHRYARLSWFNSFMAVAIPVIIIIWTVLLVSSL